MSGDSPNRPYRSHHRHHSLDSHAKHAQNDQKSTDSTNTLVESSKLRSGLRAISAASRTADRTSPRRKSQHLRPLIAPFQPTMIRFDDVLSSNAGTRYWNSARICVGNTRYGLLSYENHGHAMRSTIWHIDKREERRARPRQASSVVLSQYTKRSIYILAQPLFVSYSEIDKSLLF